MFKAHAITLRPFICHYCHEAATSTAWNPKACSKYECQKARQRDRKPTIHNKPKPSRAKPPEPIGDDRDDPAWNEIEQLLADEARYSKSD